MLTTERERVLLEGVDKLLAKGLFNEAVELYIRFHPGCPKDQARKLIGTRANNGYYTRIKKVRKKMVESINMHCLAFDTFEATEQDVHKCFVNASNRCWEYIKDIRDLAKKNGGS